MTFRSVFFSLLSAGLVSAADPGLMNLLMPNAKVVAGINVGQAKTSPFGQFLLSQAPADTNLTAKTGFNPRTDLNEVLMGSAGLPARQGLILARGTFNPPLILAAAQAAGRTVETYNGVQVVTGTKNSVNHAVAFLGNTIAMAGDLDSVHAAIDRRTATSTAIDPALATLVQQLSESLDAWSVSTVPLSSLADQKLPNEQLNNVLNSDLLKSIQQTSGGVKFGSSVQLSAQAVADTSQNATALADVARFLANMVQANAPAPAAAAIASLIQSLSVQANGNTVNLAASVPESQVESLVRAAHSHQ
jgi:hypothetical protein